MIKKQNIWFLTLFSLVLVLGVYYVTMPNEILLENNDNNTTTPVNSEIEDNAYLTALEVQLEDERQELKQQLQQTLNSSETSSEEKNNAYLSLKKLDETQGAEELIEKKIKEKFELDSFVKIDNEDISIVVIKKDHDISLANKIMRSVQEEFKDQKSIAIKFQI